MTDDTHNSKRCELCSSAPSDGMRLCATCQEMIQRLSWILSGPQPASDDATVGTAAQGKRAEQRHNRAFNISIFNASEYAKE
mgnify:CR=1 FL=1